MSMSSVKDDLNPILPKSGQLLIEDTKELLLCKPRLIPLKSYTLEKLEQMQQEAQKILSEQKNSEKAVN